MTAQAQAEFFNFHATGIAYLNRVREVKPRAGQPYLAASLSVLRGRKDAVEYSQVEVIVSGSEAIRVAESLIDESNDKGTKVLVSFRVGDLSASAFEYTQGERRGELGCNIRARLIKLFWVKVNGELVYEAPKAEDDAPASDAASEEPPAAASQPDRAERTSRRTDERPAQRATSSRGQSIGQSNGYRPSTRRAA